MTLQEKKAIVTGGTRGIGRAIVEELAARGCKVVFTFHSSEETAKEVEKAVAEKGGEAYGIKADAALFDEAEKVAAFAQEKLGGVDILVNNAGITKDGLLLRMKEEDFDSVINANLKSVFNYTKAVLKPMMGQRYGRIINISSVVALIGNPGQANYVASKAGVIGFTKSSAKELAARNITVNAVTPGFIDTDMTSSLNEKQQEAILSMIPMKKTGSGKDVAGAVAYLASDEAAYVTGQVLSVDGGMAM